MVDELDPRSLGLSFGVTFGAAIMLLGVSSWGLDYGTEAVELLAGFYKGYAPTPVGAVIGGFWGFFDAFIGGFAIAWLYNYFQENI